MTVGLAVWMTVGLAVWTTVGLAVWMTVGLAVWTTVGLAVWMMVGLAVGIRVLVSTVGPKVMGEGVGAWVRLIEGSSSMSISAQFQLYVSEKTSIH